MCFVRNARSISQTPATSGADANICKKKSRFVPRSETFSLIGGCVGGIERNYFYPMLHEFRKIHAWTAIKRLASRVLRSNLFSPGLRRALESVNTTLEINIASWNAAAVLPQTGSSGYFSISEHLIGTSSSMLAKREI